MCTVLLPPGDNPIAVNKYIISYHKKESFCSEVEGKSLFVFLQARLKSILLAADAENLNSFYKNRKK